MAHNQIAPRRLARTAVPETGIRSEIPWSTMATRTAHIDLPAGDHTVSDARSFAHLTARAWEPGVPMEDLLLLVDELATAVVQRAADGHGLVLELTGAEHGLRVSLCDGSAARSAAVEALHGATHLAALLVALADRWGDEPYQDGYCLWFDLPPARADRDDDGAGTDDVDPDVHVESLLRLLSSTRTEPDSD